MFIANSIVEASLLMEQTFETSHQRDSTALSHKVARPTMTHRMSLAKQETLRKLLRHGLWHWAVLVAVALASDIFVPVVTCSVACLLLLMDTHSPAHFAELDQGTHAPWQAAQDQPQTTMREYD